MQNVTDICKLNLTYVSDILRFQFHLLYVSLFGSHTKIKLCLEGINYITFVEIFLDKLIILQSKSSKRTHRELPSSEATLSGICLPA